MITCPCGGKTHVADTRPLDDGIWRKRRCRACKVTFTTFEQMCLTEAFKKGRPLGTTRDKPIPHQVRTIQPVAPRVIKTNPHSQPPGRRVADPVLASARSRMEDARLQSELEKGDY